MQTDQDGELTIGIAFAGIAPIAVAGALVGARGAVVSANIALMLTLVVVAAGTLGGRLPGVTAAIVSALSYDFFHTRPYLSLTIDSSDDLETTVLLLLVGLATGTLSGRLRHAGEEVATGRSELHRLSRIGDLVARGADQAEIVFAVQGELSELLGLQECVFEAATGGAPAGCRLERSGTLGELGTGTVHRLNRRGGFELPATGVDLPVLSQGRPVGRFRLVPQPGVGTTLEARVVAVALADQVGAALAARPAARTAPFPSQPQRGS